MAKKKIFIDGREGTTGLKIFERLGNRSDIEILLIDEEKRKDPAERKRLINESDYTFLCLPDAAAIEAVSLCENPETIIIDASTAHRTNPEWAYGFPELSAEHRAKIQTSKRIAVPGCYASGFASIVYPLVKSGFIDPCYPVCCHAVSGYSGAGKKAIAQYEAQDRNPELDSPRLYALTQEHKHLPEMMKISGLDFKPVFNPYICDYFAGMAVSIPLHTRMMDMIGSDAFIKFGSNDRTNAGQAITSMYKKHYEGSRFVKVADFMGSDVLTESFIASNPMAGTNNMQIIVYGNDERITVTSRFDNLGKGASGAAVQCMNISMGIDEGMGL
ncbi:MAG: N-acetyl-gamma-glutamyl-phosphate reductase [Treponemataceae bacterium]|nr:N-acetyl-gamma-glutamyl-phosphate reductase [Treponemataceae bacterium]